MARTLPPYINPKAKLGEDGRIENLSEFKSFDDIFDFSGCLQCSALLDEHYGACSESPCMACQEMVRKIIATNRERYDLLKNKAC